MANFLLFPSCGAIAFLLLLFAAGRVAQGGKMSCTQTPYPGMCEYMMADAGPLSTSSSEEKGDAATSASFLIRALRATMAEAERAKALFSAVDTVALDPAAKAAWADCVELCDDTLARLSFCLDSTNSTTRDDDQTWLSAAMTNLLTCQNGFAELNCSQPVGSSMLSNFSEMLSNSLAINMAEASADAGHGRRLLSARRAFPDWVGAGERRLLQSSGTAGANLVVAQDGSGNYKTISEAVAAAASGGRGDGRFVIYVKKGTYNENVVIKRSERNLMLIGDGKGITIVTGSKNVADGSTTFASATFAVSGDGFIAKDMTFRNTAGPQKHQAVAIRSGADLSVFYRCSFEGYQDTLYVYAQRQFYRDCDIYGTIDFIFGNAAVVLQNCNIYVRRPMAGQWTTVTAQGRTDPNQNTGISIHNSVVAAASDLAPVQGSFKNYLGRPWQRYSRTVFMKTNLGSLIDPSGWLPWSGNFALSTLYYGEYMNTGPGAATGGRVNWPGFHVITNAAEAARFTVAVFLGGGSWISSAAVPFVAGL